MLVKTFYNKLYDQNCYLLYGESEAILIDPIDPGAGVINFIKDRLQVTGIINTHGHVDHIAANGWYKQKTGAKLMIHESDSHYLCDPNLNMSNSVGKLICGPAADVFLRDGDELHINGAVLKVIHCPGHTPGSICLYAKGILISGDTLFRQAVGRTDLPGGDSRALKATLQALQRLPKETTVYPGHGKSTTIGDEIASNRYL